jgi:hypothetical protein
MGFAQLPTGRIVKWSDVQCIFSFFIQAWSILVIIRLAIRNSFRNLCIAILNAELLNRL